MSFVRIDRPSTGPRVYIADRIRIHHGFAGALAVLGGLFACWTDRADARDWFRFR